MYRKSLASHGFLLAGRSLLALILFLFSSEVEAHEFWLAPSSHKASEGANVDVYAMIGHGKDAETLVRRRDHLKTFLVHGDVGSRELSGRNRRLPTGKFRAQESGLQIVAYESYPQENVLPGAEFDAYLRKEGLDEALASRQRAGEALKEGRELYTRFAKCLIQVGDKGGADRALGFPLELVVMNRVSKVKVGETLVVQVLRDGEPIPGLLVKAFSLAAESEPVGVRTDFDGLAKIVIGRTGRWMLNTVSMEPAEDTSETDWQSYWASVTFEVPEGDEAR